MRSSRRSDLPHHHLMSPRSRVIASAAVGAILVLGTVRASAFCRTTTCDPAVENCQPPLGQECTTKGIPLVWPVRCVSFSVQENAAPDISLEKFREVAQRSFASWADANCGNGVLPSFEAHELEPVSCDAVEYNQRAGNANILMFRTTSWPYTSTSHTLALTTVTFNREDGEIYDVDMEINDAQVPLTTGDQGVEYDLESVLTHEIGHFLGLAHSGDSNATMYAKYKRGTTGLRSLETDDIRGICTAYPAGRTTGPCDPTPRHGFQQTCGDGSPPDEGGCAVSTATRRDASWPWFLGLLALAGYGLRHRQRARR